MSKFGDLKLCIAQINPTIGAIDINFEKITKIWHEHDKDCDLIIFPELSLTGYSPEDLLQNIGFIDAVSTTIQKLVDYSRKMSAAILIGAPQPATAKLYNSALLIEHGKIIGTVHKHELPNYGVFDECRYFTKGEPAKPILFRGVKLGVMICEDMWFTTVSENLAKNGAEGFIVLNASPFEVNKQISRINQAKLRVTTNLLPLIYINQIGGQDDLVFDGASFAVNAQGDICLQCREFAEEVIPFSFNAQSTHIIKILDETASIYNAVTLGLHDYMRKTGQKKILLGLSGGIDSAISAAIAVDAIGAENVYAVMMPSKFTSKDSVEDAEYVANKLGINYTVAPITNLVDCFLNEHPNTSGLAYENLQSRMRGITLMTMSNQTGAMVLSTGNKSEMATGYATIYGDMCGGYNAIKDVYKTKVYEMAHWRNANKPINAMGCDGVVINERTIIKAPTAELRENQTDQDSLPPYDELDQILECLIEFEMGINKTIERGFNAKTVQKVAKLLKNSEFKRKQSVLGPKVSSRAFTRERRYPIVNGFN